MAEVNVVVGRVKCMRKSERIVLLIWEAISVNSVANMILVVADVGTDAMPPQFFISCLILTVREHPHPLVVKTVRLGQVNNVEPNFLAFGCVTNSEEEPLSVSIGIDVILEHQIVFILRDLHGDK